MDIFDIRRENLRLAAIAALAKEVATDPAFLSQLLSADSGANMDSELARKIEGALGLEQGWMEVSHPIDAKDQHIQTLIRHAASLSVAQLEQVTALLQATLNLSDTAKNIPP